MKRITVLKDMIAGLCAASVLCTSGMTCTAAKKPDKTEVYISASGNDSNNGDKSNPFKTPERARDYLRELKKSGQLGRDGAVVYFREGDYRVTESFELTKEDSGTKEAPTCYRAYPNENVRLLGGEKVDENLFSPVTDPEAIKRIGNDTAAKNILVAKLSDMGIDEIPPIVLTGAYSYMIEEYLEFNGYPSEKPAQGIEVFLNGKSCTNARYPNEGELYTANIKEEGSDGGVEWYDDPSKYSLSTFVPPEERKPELMKLPTFTMNDSSHLEKWKDAKGALVYGKFMYLWADQTIALKEVNTANKTMTLAWPSLYKVGSEKPFYVFNLLEELDVPGEYYIDRDEKLIYIYPPEHTGKLDIVLSLLTDPIISMKDCEYVTIKNMDIGMTRGSAVNVSGGTHNLIDGCEIYYTGARAVMITDGTYNGMINSHVHDVEGGVTIEGGSSEKLTSAYNYIENCEINDFMRFQKTYNTGIQVNGVGNRVTNCSLHGGEHTSLGYVGQYNTIEYNELYDLANQAADMGALYVGRYYISRGNRVMYNYIHDILSPAGDVKALYFDDGQSGDYIFGNVMKNIKGAGVHMTGADTTVLNNIFIDCERSVLMDYRGSLSNLSHYHSTDWTRYEYFDSPLWLEHFPELADAREKALTEEGFHRNNVISNNVLVNSGDVYLHPNLPRTWGVNKNNFKTETDPGFYDAENDNFLLKKDSVVYKEIPDFKPIPFTRMGMYTKRAADRVKDAIVLAIGEPMSMVNGKIGYIDQGTDARPFIEDNKTYVPLRFIAESLGGNVDFDDVTRDVTITVGTDELKLNLDKNEVFKNGEAKELENVPKKADGRTYLPLREMMELLGREVFWDDSGVIVISETKDLLDNTVDEKIISYLKNEISVY